MKLKKILSLSLIVVVPLLSAQNKTKKPEKWDLTSCIDYALNNNIQIQKAKISLESNKVSTLQAKAQLLPNLSAGITQSAGYNPFRSSGVYTGSYGLNTSLKVFDGGQNLKSVQQQQLQEETGRYNIVESEKSIQMSVLQTYAKVLYADEAVKVDSETVAKSEYQLQRGKELARAGSISGADLAQLEAQLSSDKYQLVIAQNSLNTSRLEMRQLLELAPEDKMELIIPVLNSENVFQPQGSLQQLYETALKVMPQIKSSKTNIRISELETDKAKAAFLPTVSLNGSASTGHSSSLTSGIGDQLKDALNANVGLSVNIPIFSNRTNKSALEKSRLNEKTVQLELQQSEKDLLKEIETVYQDALSAQSQYMAASEKVKALETSYALIEQQFNLGMKNTLELLTEKNNLISARQSMMQAKYVSIVDVQILNLYQDNPVSIK